MAKRISGRKKDVHFRLDESTVKALDAIAARLSRQHGYKHNRTDALRYAVHQAARGQHETEE